METYQYTIHSAMHDVNKRPTYMSKLYANATEKILISVGVEINSTHRFEFIKLTAHIDLSISHSDAECIFH